MLRFSVHVLSLWAHHVTGAVLHTVCLRCAAHMFVLPCSAVAVGEYISVAGQRDTEEADIQKEREQQAKGPEAQRHELEELAQIYVNRYGDMKTGSGIQHGVYMLRHKQGMSHGCCKRGRHRVVCIRAGLSCCEKVMLHLFFHE